MSAEHGAINHGAMRFAYVVAMIFFGTLMTGIVVLIGFMASACVISSVNRCFSVARDTAPAISYGVKLWSLPAAIVAFLVAFVARVQGFVMWWNALVAATASALLIVVAAAIREGDIFDVPIMFAAESMVLFVGVQLSLVIGRSVGKLAI